ncbi:MAG: alpha/beta hydrolase [Chitinophagaceae bacterium]
MTSLNTVDNGNGQPTLVFLHYFGGSSRTWRFVVDHLAARFRCISVDLPGFGGSADIAMPDYTVASSAVAFSESLLPLNAGEFLLVAHSMGAKIAVQYAATNPAGLISVILMAPSPPVPEPMNASDRQALKEMYGKPDLIKEHLRKIAHVHIPDDMLEELLDDNLRANIDAWNSWAEIGSKEDISRLSIQVPVHFIAGEFDDPLSPEYIQAIAEKFFPGSEVTTIPGAAHLLPIEAPAEVAALISTLAGIGK